MASLVRQGMVNGGQHGVIGGSWGVGLLEVHPVVAVFVGWGCAMVSRTIHIPKP